MVLLASRGVACEQAVLYSASANFSDFIVMSHSEVSQLISRLVRPEIQAMQAYSVADATGLLKLDAMENPYTWPSSMQQEWLEVLKDVEMNRYPDPEGRALCEQLRRAMVVPQGQALLLGNGSDELIQILALALARPGAKLMAFEPGFVMYRLIAELAGMDYLGVPLNSDNFSIDLEQTLLAVRTYQPALIFIAYPNNPTGNAFDTLLIDTIVEEAEGLVVIDEAYQPFAEDSFMGRLGQHGNMLVMRTVSKLGLAGLRLGVLAAAPALINELNKVRLPYNINVLTQASATFALKHAGIFARQAAIIRAERHNLQRALAAIRGVQVFPSRANFILFKVPAGRADGVFADLKVAGILIKNMHPAGGVLQDCLRVTVGTPEQNQQFLAALRKIL